MINAVLMIGSVIAAAAIIVLGLLFAFSPLGSVWMGLTLTVMGAVLAAASVPPGLAEYRRWRQRRFLREQAAHASVRTQRPKLRLVKAVEEKPAKVDQRQPPTAA
jgi:hypothetical protein